MSIPGLRSNITKQLERPKPRSVEEILSGGPQAPPMTPERRAGYSVDAQIAQRSAEETEEHLRRRQAAAAAQTKAEDARWEQILRERATAVGINRQLHKEGA